MMMMIVVIVIPFSNFMLRKARERKLDVLVSSLTEVKLGCYLVD